MEDNNFTPPPVPPVDGLGGWQAPPVRDTSDDIPPLKPNNWLWQSIVATILCCLIFGVVGIIYAAKWIHSTIKANTKRSVREKGQDLDTDRVVVGVVYIALACHYTLR